MAESSESNSSILEEVETLTDPQKSQNLLNLVSQVRKTGLYTDVTIIVGTERFPAHRLVLASVSDYFPPLFRFDQNQPSEVTLPNIKPENFVIFLNYAYTGKVDITKDNVQDILMTFDYLNVDFIKECCITFMAANLDCDNICDVLTFSLNYPLLGLAEKAKDFFSHHLEEISQTETFSQMDATVLEKIFVDDNLTLYQGSDNNSVLASTEREELVLNSVLRYLSKLPGSNPEVTEMMIRTVRLPQLSKDVVKKFLKNFKSLEDNEVIKKYITLQDMNVEQARILAVPEFLIENGCRRYASGGQIRHTPNPPTFLYDDPNIQIQCIEIWLRMWDDRVVIGGLGVTYRRICSHTRANSVQYRGYCPENQPHDVVELEPDELIVEVVSGSGYLIDRLGFKTNKGRVFGPFGGPGGSEIIETAPASALSYLYDINCDTVNTQEADAIFNLMLRWIKFS